MYWYYRIIYGTGSEKLVKTNCDSCEVYLKSPFGNKYESFDKPYPIFDEPGYDQLTEKEFIQALGTLDFETVNTKEIHEQY